MPEEITISVKTVFAKRLANLLHQMDCFNCPTACWKEEKYQYCEELAKEIEEKLKAR